MVDAPEFQGLRPATLDLIEQAAWSLRFRLRTAAGRRPGRHVRPGNLAGTCVLHPKLTTFDVSALPEDGPSTAMVMVVANAWLMGMLISPFKLCRS